MDFEVKEDQALTAKLKARQPKPSYHFENILNELAIDSAYKQKKQFAKIKYYQMLKSYFSILDSFVVYFSHPKDYCASDLKQLRNYIIQFLGLAYHFTHPKVKHHPIFDPSLKSRSLRIKEDAASDIFSYLLQMQDLIIYARYGSTDYINSHEDNAKLNAALIKLFTLVQNNSH